MMSFFIAVLAGILLADFLSGFVHWVQDRYGRPSWPIVGSAIADGHAHHDQPLAFLDAGFLKRNGATMILTGTIGALVAALGGLNTMTVTAMIVGGLSNEIHALTHRRGLPALIAVPRFIGLLQYPAHHLRHHGAAVRGISDRYCVITAWLNPALDYIGFWTRAEEGVFAILGVYPNYRAIRGDK